MKKSTTSINPSREPTIVPDPDPEPDPEPIKVEEEDEGGDLETKQTAFFAKGVGVNKYYLTVANACEELIKSGDTWGAAAYAKEALDKGLINNDEYSYLLGQNNPLLDSLTASYLSNINN